MPQMGPKATSRSSSLRCIVAECRAAYYNDLTVRTPLFVIGTTKASQYVKLDFVTGSKFGKNMRAAPDGPTAANAMTSVVD